MGTILNKLGNNIYDGWMIISQSQTKVEEILMWTYIYIYIHNTCVPKLGV